MLTDEKILVTGAAGRVAFGLAEFLAANNEVWGLDLYRSPGSREEVKAIGVRPFVCDLFEPDLESLPTNFSYLVHLAADFSAEDFDRAIRINAEGTGLLLEHCRRAKAALVMSAAVVYQPHDDPWYAYREGDALGDSSSTSFTSYPVSKIAQESVARYCSRRFDLPVTIARLGTHYGVRGGLPAWHLDLLAQGLPIVVRHDPLPYSLIHDRDVQGQLDAMLDAASVPGTTANWGGDQPVSVQEYCAFLGGLTGRRPDLVVEPVPGASRGAVVDGGRRMSITGPSAVDWQAGLRDLVAEKYPSLVRTENPESHRGETQRHER